MVKRNLLGAWGLGILTVGTCVLGIAALFNFAAAIGGAFIGTMSGIEIFLRCLISTVIIGAGVGTVGYLEYLKDEGV